ncbi:hypothetical protein [Georgenia yuyongxinii]
MTAPHARVDAAWENDFVLELRLLDVDGRLIGDALEQVRAHCAQSGESAEEAFGEPGAYARRLEMPTEPARLAGVLAPSLVGLAGMFVTLAAVQAWDQGEPFTLTVGLLVAIGVVVAAVTLAARHLRSIVDHTAWAIVLATVPLAAAVVAGVLLTAAVVRLPALPIVVLGVALLLGAAITEHRAVAGMADPVVSPVDAAGAARAQRSARRSGILGAWLMPTGTAVLAVVGWLLL